jgi:hypothetical protein
VGSPIVAGGLSVKRVSPILLGILREYRGILIANSSVLPPEDVTGVGLLARTEWLIREIAVAAVAAAAMVFDSDFGWIGSLR